MTNDRAGNRALITAPVSLIKRRVVITADISAIAAAIGHAVTLHQALSTQQYCSSDAISPTKWYFI